MSADTMRRNSEKSLRGIVHDIYLLSKCAYLVCTFSSQVGAIESMGSPRTPLVGDLPPVSNKSPLVLSSVKQIMWIHIILLVVLFIFVIELKSLRHKTQQMQNYNHTTDKSNILEGSLYLYITCPFQTNATYWLLDHRKIIKYTAIVYTHLLDTQRVSTTINPPTIARCNYILTFNSLFLSSVHLLILQFIFVFLENFFICCIAMST